MMTRIRAWLPWLAMALICIGFWVALYCISPLIVGGALAALVAVGLLCDLVRWCRRRGEDLGYDTTPFGIEGAQRSPVSTETVHAPAVALTVIEGGKRAVWPHEAGAPE